MPSYENAPFEIHVHGVAIDPEPELRRWDRYS